MTQRSADVQMCNRDSLAMAGRCLQTQVNFQKDNSAVEEWDEYPTSYTYLPTLGYLSAVMDTERERR